MPATTKVAAITLVRQDDPVSVGTVFRFLFLHPRQSLLREWNWKAAIFASLLRGAIFFVSTWKAGWHAATSAMLVEFCYRAATSGFWGAMTQAFHGARPAWLATVCALIVIPAISHILELVIHLSRGTSHLWAGMTSSIVFTVLATLFNLYAMRRGAMLVGTGAQSFTSDLRRIPLLIAGFVASGPKAIWRATRRLIHSD